MVTSLAVICMSDQLMAMRGLVSSSAMSAVLELTVGARGANSEFAAAETTAFAMVYEKRGTLRLQY